MKRANHLLVVYNGLKTLPSVGISAEALFLATSQSNPPKKFAVPTAAARDVNAPAQQA